LRFARHTKIYAIETNGRRTGLGAAGERDVSPSLHQPGTLSGQTGGFEYSGLTSVNHSVISFTVNSLSYQDIGYSYKYSLLSSLTGFIAMGLCCFFTISAHSDVFTSFDGSSLDPNVNLDIPDPGVGTISLDTINHALLFTGSGDLWYDRNGLPFAWTAKPQVNAGETWRVETEVQYNDPQQNVRIAGITLYDGPDGAGGFGAGQEFTFGLDQWDGPNGVWVQGLGDNHPGDSDNLYNDLATDSVFLRMDVTEGEVLDTFDFYYKLAASDPWSSLGSLNAKFPDNRVALFFKGTDVNVSFDYFDVHAVPEPSSLALFGVILTGFFIVQLGKSRFRWRHSVVPMR
jgi:hypothetical protein